MRKASLIHRSFNGNIHFTFELCQLVYIGLCLNAKLVKCKLTRKCPLFCRSFFWAFRMNSWMKEEHGKVCQNNDVHLDSDHGVSVSWHGQMAFSQYFYLSKINHLLMLHHSPHFWQPALWWTLCSQLSFRKRNCFVILLHSTIKSLSNLSLDRGGVPCVRKTFFPTKVHSQGSRKKEKKTNLIEEGFQDVDFTLYLNF